VCGDSIEILIDRPMRPDHPVPRRLWYATDVNSSEIISLNKHPPLLPFLTLLLGGLESGEPSPPASSSDYLPRSLC
jgi:hypothetical protein